MKRRNFLSNIALTLPVGLLAPDLIFAADNYKNAQQTQAIIIGKDAATIDAHQQLLHAQLSSLLTTATIQPILSAAVVNIQQHKNGFVVTDKNGNHFNTEKLLISSPISVNTHSSALTFEDVFGTPQIHFHSAGRITSKLIAVQSETKRIANSMKRLMKIEGPAVTVVQ